MIGQKFASHGMTRKGKSLSVMVFANCFAAFSVLKDLITVFDDG